MALDAKKNIRLICFDLDGTLISKTIFIWSTLHEYFKTDAAERKRAHDDFFAGKMSYADWFATDLRLLSARGADRPGMLEALAALRPSPGAKEVLLELKKRGYRLGVISGSLDFVLEHFFDPDLFDHILINKIDFDSSGKIAGGTPTPYDLVGKADGLVELARRENLGLSQCAFIGDNFNDLAVMKIAGFSIGVNVNSHKVTDTADLIIESDDLRKILPLFPPREK
jgi:HAD superfamily phosphoserine phosphatase-like hydrolase